jgi:ribosomal protein S18 acetylase RimI-like enzyme
MTDVAVEIAVADGPTAVATLRGLFREYQAQLGVDLCFQGFEAELAALPGDYAPPRGRLLLASRAGEPLGCVAMRPLDATTCEMKRLYVRDAARGLGLGRRLAERLIAEARALGYRRMALDTLPSMAAAQGLYRSLGFAPIAPYTFNPVEGSRYLGLDLAAEGAA